MRWQLGELVRFDAARPVRQILVDSERLRMAVICLKEGQELGRHPAPGEAVVHFHSGRAVFQAGGEEWEVGRGAIIRLRPGELHSVRALRDTVLTVCAAPGGEREGRGPGG